MSSSEVTVARIYAIEGHDQVNQVLDILHDEVKIIGVSIFRGIAGYGEDRQIHTSSLLTLSLELPLIIEFYDKTEKVEKAIQALKSRVSLKHIVSWPATAHFDTSV